MFIYYNPNPRGKNAGDCVVRAIAKTTGQDWESIYAELSAFGYSFGDWGNSNGTWAAYLKRKGFSRHIIPDTCPDCYTVEDFAAEHPDGRYIAATGEHAVAVVDGDIYDSWDSSYEVPIYYFHKS